jgi:hypothetical protein
MTKMHASYIFTFTPSAVSEQPVVHEFVLDSPKDMPTFDSVTQAFLGFLSEVHGYEITVDMLTEQTATA